MSESYIGEIRIFAGSFAPRGWHFCDGSLLAIADYDALFALIGTTYGGDGRMTFGLPDLRGRIPVHLGSGQNMGQAGGAETVTLTVNQIPNHHHSFMAAAGVGNQSTPGGHVIAQSPQIKMYIEDAEDGNMAANAAGPKGGSQPHSNLMPYICINHIISLVGIFPSRT